MSRLTKTIISIIEAKYVASVNELAETLQASPKNIAAILHYLVKTRRISRVRKGLYADKNAIMDPMVIATALFEPSYVSFTTALSLYGVVDQLASIIEVAVPYSLPRTSRKILVNGVFVKYYKMKPDFMFGYRYRESNVVRGYYYYIAIPEKAFLDYIYKFGDPEATLTVNWDKLRTRLLLRLSRKYPVRVRELLKQKLQE